MQHPPSIKGIPWDQFKTRAMRMRTFENYPSSAEKHVMDLVVSGFVYIGDGVSDKVMCFYCHIEKENWRADENVDTMHRPHCTRSSENLDIAGSHRRAEINTDTNYSDAAASRHMALANEGAAALHENCSIHTRNTAPSAQVFSSSSFSSLSQTDYRSMQVLHNPSSQYGSAENFLELSGRETDSPSAGAVPLADQQAVPWRQQDSDMTGHQGLNNMHSLPSFLDQDPNSLHYDTSSHNIASVHNFDETASHTHPPRTSHVSSTSRLQTHPYSRPELASRPEQSHAVPQTQGINVSSPMPTMFESSGPVVSSSNVTSVVNASSSTDSNPPSSSTQHSRRNPRDFGIYTEKPKHPEYASYEQRVQSFNTPKWTCTYPSKEDLARAGLYFGGRVDCGRCFFCGGGLRNWDSEDSPYVEHARWFPKCAYIRQYMGPDFVDSVQKMPTPASGTVSFSSVIDFMREQGTSLAQLFGGTAIEDDKAVKALLSLVDGSKKDVICSAALKLREKGVTLSADVILEKIGEEAPGLLSTSSDTEAQEENKESTGELRNQNHELRRNFACKICLNQESQLAFLPCGHLAACQECAMVLSICPICRKNIDATVRVYIP